MNDKGVLNPLGALEFLHWDHSWNNYKYPSKRSLQKIIGLIRDAGVGCVRLDFLWQDIEPKQGAFQFSKYDYIVNLLLKNNIQILGLLNYSTGWASPKGKWNCPSSDTSFFVNYARSVAGRYKNQVKYWEIWNEPDSSVYWEKQDGLRRYCFLLRDTYRDLKRINPEFKVLNGGFANGAKSVEQFYKHRPNRCFDILNIHIFDSPGHPGYLKRMVDVVLSAYRVMLANGDGAKKIWVTETGCPGVKRGIKTNNWWLGTNPTEKAQAEFVKLVIPALIRCPQVEKVFWAFFRDTWDHWQDGTDYLGLVRWDFSRKPAFFNYKKIIDF